MVKTGRCAVHMLALGKEVRWTFFFFTLRITAQQEKKNYRYTAEVQTTFSKVHFSACGKLIHNYRHKVLEIINNSSSSLTTYKTHSFNEEDEANGFEDFR